ncbi:MBL fold metallo-hydrolase [Paractinoplanes toevensis]|uniref:MBL fold metallo-hydrolase n=1 Tax=Paractinoplanes toevensis TaxID=571911 RepID=A0A919W1Z1_9ACTN|nr:MBL fold metallo-hydrolase [Actinoplanes toevensis]GIM93002.1 MBL fold metallo-hydrolase [Actinoplanes toevensis]
MDNSTRRSFLAGAAALAAAPVAGSAAAALATPAAAFASAGATAEDPNDLPDYAPIPPSSLGKPVNSLGYAVGKVSRNLYFVTDTDYLSAFIATRDGVVLLDAPPTLGHNIQRAIDEVTKPLGLPNKVTHLIYTHHHSDHAGASSIFGKNIARIGHSETRRLLKRDNDPKKPAPEETFDDHRTLHIGGERIELHWFGENHTPDNIYIHLPGHDALVLVDIAYPGWVPFSNLNLSEDVPGSVAASAKALELPWKHFLGGHLGRVGTRRDVQLHDAYMADLNIEVRRALTTVDPTPFYAKYGANAWAAVKHHLNYVSSVAAEPVIKKYLGRLGAVDVNTESIAFALLESARLNQGFEMSVHD